MENMPLRLNQHKDLAEESSQKSVHINKDKEIIKAFTRKLKVRFMRSKIQQQFQTEEKEGGRGLKICGLHKLLPIKEDNSPKNKGSMYLSHNQKPVMFTYIHTRVCTHTHFRML